MYIVISLIVHGPDIEKAAVTIRKLINQACSRIEKGDKVYCVENAKRCNMDSEPGDHFCTGTPSFAMPFMKPSM